MADKTEGLSDIAPDYDDLDIPFEGERDTGGTDLYTSPSTYPDLTSGAGGGSSSAGMVDYSSLLQTAIKTAGDIGKAVADRPLPAPVAAAAEAARKAAEAAARPTPGAEVSPGSVARAAGATGVSTGAVVGLVAATLATAGLVTLAATRKGRR